MAASSSNDSAAERSLVDAIASVSVSVSAPSAATPAVAAHHAFIWDEAQVRRFEAIVYTPEAFHHDGCHVINLSVRAKYDVHKEMTLSGKQGMHIEVGERARNRPPAPTDPSSPHTPNTQHRIINEPGKLVRTIKKYNVPVDAFVDDASRPIPPHCMSVYSTLDNRR